MNYIEGIINLDNDNNRIEHHGVLGMKWGRRKSKIGSGVSRPKGHKESRIDRYVKNKKQQKVEKDRVKRMEKINAEKRAAEIKRINKLKKKPLNELTNAELNFLYERAQKELNYKNTQRMLEGKPVKNPNKPSFVVDQIVKPLITQGVVNGVNRGTSQVISDNIIKKYGKKVG